MAGRGSSCDKVGHDHPLNGLLANDNSGLIECELTRGELNPFEEDWTDETLVKVQQAKISLMPNILKRELHPMCLLNNDMNSNPLICVFLWPLELQTK